MTQWYETEPRPLESDELQNARALIEKLEGLNASLQHQVTALHSELARADEHANELRAKMAQQADLEPDMDTVPLQALLEAVGTFLKPGQAVTIRGSYEATSEVDIQAMGLAFRVPTFEAHGAITRASRLGECMLVEVGA